MNPRGLVIAAMLSGLVPLACRGKEGRLSGEASADTPLVESVPTCARTIEARGMSVQIVAELKDEADCEEGTVVLRATWPSGRSQSIDLEDMGFPTDLWVVDLGENGTDDVLVGHEDLSGQAPRVRAFEDAGGSLREYPLAGLENAVLGDYRGGGNFYTRGGLLFFAYPTGSGKRRTVAFTERTRTWAEIDPQTFETDRPR